MYPINTREDQALVCFEHLESSLRGEHKLRCQAYSRPHLTSYVTATPPDLFSFSLDL